MKDPVTFKSDGDQRYAVFLFGVDQGVVWKGTQGWRVSGLKGRCFGTRREAADALIEARRLYAVTYG